ASIDASSEPCVAMAVWISASRFAAFASPVWAARATAARSSASSVPRLTQAARFASRSRLVGSHFSTSVMGSSSFVYSMERSVDPQGSESARFSVLRCRKNSLNTLVREQYLFDGLAPRGRSLVTVENCADDATERGANFIGGVRPKALVFVVDHVLSPWFAWSATPFRKLQQPSSSAGRELAPGSALRLRARPAPLFAVAPAGAPAGRRR